MFRNYLKIALRSLAQHKVFSFINIAGLAVGIGACLLIMLFVRSEWSYDRFHANGDRLYRVWVREVSEGQELEYTSMPFLMGPTLAASFPEIESAVRLVDFSDFVRRGDVVFTEQMYLADSTFFEVFSFPLVKGDGATALDAPNQVVLTEAAAAKYFRPGEEPLGQALQIRVADSVRTFIVTGIAVNVPEHSSVRFDFLLPMALHRDLYSERARTSWFNIFAETYVLLKDDGSSGAVEAKFPEVVKRQILGDGYEPGLYHIGLQPITDIHLKGVPGAIEPDSDPAYSLILSGIALFILLIAGINFTTLSVGRSAGRALEVGVRKVLGAQRRQLMQQFWGEALLLSGLALVLGVALAHLFLPLFNTLSGRELDFSVDAFTALFVVTLALAAGLAAGGYPAAVLSAFRPVEVLKGKLSLRGDRSLLQRGLIVIQFALSIFLMIGTLTMARQMHYLQTKHLGFDKEQVVVIPTEQEGEEAFRLVARFRNALRGRPEVTGMAASAFALGEGWMEIGFTDDAEVYRELSVNIVEPEYVRAMGMEIAAGRDFSREVESDARRALIVNEALVRAYGWKDPIGQRLPGGFEDHEVIGVVKDFNFASLRAEVEPAVLAMGTQAITSGAENFMVASSTSLEIAVRVAAGQVPAALALLEQTWDRVAPGQPFSYSFLDEVVDSQYRQEQRLSRIVLVASALAIVIACMGLFGLAALAAVRRTKEIGVRKVLGAGVSSIVLLLSREFALLVLVAAVMAAPAGYFVMTRWLQGFAFRISVDPLTLAAAALVALVIAFGTVTYHALRAATADPVKSLRYE